MDCPICGAKLKPSQFAFRGYAFPCGHGLEFKKMCLSDLRDDLKDDNVEE